MSNQHGREQPAAWVPSFMGLPNRKYTPHPTVRVDTGSQGKIPAAHVSRRVLFLCEAYRFKSPAMHYAKLASQHSHGLLTLSDILIGRLL